MPKPQVWTWEPNSNSGKPLFALAQKGVEFDFRAQERRERSISSAP